MPHISNTMAQCFKMPSSCQWYILKDWHSWCVQSLVEIHILDVFEKFAFPGLVSSKVLWHPVLKSCSSHMCFMSDDSGRLQCVLDVWKTKSSGLPAVPALAQLPNFEDWCVPHSSNWWTLSLLPLSYHWRVSCGSSDQIVIPFRWYTWSPAPTSSVYHLPEVVQTHPQPCQSSGKLYASRHLAIQDLSLVSFTEQHGLSRCTGSTKVDAVQILCVACTFTV